MSESDSKSLLDINYNEVMKKLEEMDKSRCNENTLSKIDGLYNVLITMTFFLITMGLNNLGYFLLTSNSILFFVLISNIFFLIFSYSLGVYAMVKKKISFRVLSWNVLLLAMVGSLIVIVTDFGMKNFLVGNIPFVSVSSSVAVIIFVIFFIAILNLTDFQFTHLELAKDFLLNSFLYLQMLLFKPLLDIDVEHDYWISYERFPVLGVVAGVLIIYAVAWISATMF